MAEADTPFIFDRHPYLSAFDSKELALHCPKLLFIDGMTSICRH